MDLCSLHLVLCYFAIFLPLFFLIFSFLPALLFLGFEALWSLSEDVVRLVGSESQAAFPEFLWGLPRFRGKSALCLFYLLSARPSDPHRAGRENKNILKENRTYILLTRTEGILSAPLKQSHIELTVPSYTQTLSFLYLFFYTSLIFSIPLSLLSFSSRAHNQR